MRRLGGCAVMLGMVSLVSMLGMVGTVAASGVAPAARPAEPPLRSRIAPDTLGATWRPLLDPTLAQWEVWTGVPHPSITRLPPGYRRGPTEAASPPIGLGDPFRLFTMQRDADGRPVLRISGEVYGGLTSRAAFANYHLTLEVRWGTTRWPPRETATRDAGLLYHCDGPHGAFWKVWMPCLEFQIQEGDIGDLHQLAGPRSVVRQRDGVWHPAGAATETSQPVARRANHESPPGRWTRVDLYVVGSRAVHVVNGVVVLAVDRAQQARGAALTAGRLQLQSEGAECFMRDLRVRRLRALPHAIATAAGFTATGVSSTGVSAARAVNPRAGALPTRTHAPASPSP